MHCFEQKKSSLDISHSLKFFDVIPSNTTYLDTFLSIASKYQFCFLFRGDQILIFDITQLSCLSYLSLLTYHCKLIPTSFSLSIQYSIFSFQYIFSDSKPKHKPQSMITEPHHCQYYCYPIKCLHYTITKKPHSKIVFLFCFHIFFKIWLLLTKTETVPSNNPS